MTKPAAGTRGPSGGSAGILRHRGAVPASPPGPSSWSLRIDGAADGPTNMATDHALALGISGEGAVLRLYRWAAPTLSLGRNEPARERYDAGSARRHGVAFVRRPTGGRAVLHHREVTYAVAAPLRAFGGLRAAYVAINRALARGLARLGVTVDLAGPGARGGRLEPGAGACFGAPAEGEVLAGGGKLVGSAQVRVGGALLQHGSILLADDQALVEALRLPVRREERPEGRVERASPGAASLEGLLGRAPAAEDVVEAVVGGFREALGGRWRREVGPAALPPDLLARYRSLQWTWRR